jgi:protein tyrosine phosphatase (PTP) superfamily phosphohydrolase (DUF442 family)
MKSRRFLAVTLVALVGAATVYAGGSITARDVTGPVAWGDLPVTSLQHLRFSGQPDAPALDRAKANGVEVVINLRVPSEQDWPEAKAAADRGLVYYDVPVDTAAPFSRAAFEKIESLVAQHEPKTILIHCSSGNRAAAWLATHLVTRHDMTTSDAIEVARKAGLTKDALATKVEQYIQAVSEAKNGADLKQVGEQ